MTFNAAAVRTCEALGFVRKGVRRPLAKVGEERWGTAHCAMLRADHLRRTGRHALPG